MREARSTDAAAIHIHALRTLQYIRETVDAAENFTQIPGTAGITMGLIGVATGVLVGLPALSPYWLVGWMMSAPVALTAGAVLMARKASTAGVTFHRGAGRRCVIALVPTLIAGTVLTVVLFRHGAPELIPGTWLLLYGSGVVAAGASSLPSVGYMGMCFMGLGACSFAVPPPGHNALLTLGFGLLHLGFGIFIALRYRG